MSFLNKIEAKKEEQIKARESTDDDTFRYGKCGEYALALHDLSKGKLKLGMIHGTRLEELAWDAEEDGQEELNVNVHAFVTYKDVAIDVEGKIDPSELLEEWEDENRNLDAYGDIELNLTRPKFLQLMKKTGGLFDQVYYDKAVAHIKKNKAIYKLLNLNVGEDLIIA